MKAFSERLQAVWLVIDREMEDQMPDLDDYPRPEAEEATELGDGLYNSERDYLEQIDAYKAFQG